MGEVFSRRRRRRRHYRRRLAFAATLIVLWTLVVVGISSLSDIAADLRVPAAVEFPVAPPMAVGRPAREPRLPERPVFRHSVISGGAYTAEEVLAAIGRDHIVARHYRDIDPRRLRGELLAADRSVYMSYRVGDDVYWTKQPVQLKQGETILTSGDDSIRARCGNRIAFAPMEPTMADEPEEMEFDALVEEIETAESHPPLGHELMLPPVFGVPFPWLADPGPGNDVAVRDPFDLFVPGFPDQPSDPAPIFDPPPVLWPEFVDGDPASGGSPLIYRPQNPDDPGSRDDPGGDPRDPRDPGVPGKPFYPGPTVDDPPVPVPEPATLLLVGGGLALAARRRPLARRRSKSEGAQ